MTAGEWHFFQIIEIQRKVRVEMRHSLVLFIHSFLNKHAFAVFESDEKSILLIFLYLIWLVSVHLMTKWIGWQLDWSGSKLLFKFGCMSSFVSEQLVCFFFLIIIWILETNDDECEPINEWRVTTSFSMCVIVEIKFCLFFVDMPRKYR